MSAPLVTGWPALAAGAAVVAILMALAALVSALAYRMRMLIPTEVPDARVTLILPATGPLPELPYLLDDLRHQTLPPARVIVGVESLDDPAYGRVARLAVDYSDLCIELVVAGVSSERAQKSTNILAAVSRLSVSDAYIVLFDADIRPQPWWLATLVGPLAAGRADIVNGYRWPVPQGVSLGTVIGATIDRGIAVLLRLTRIAAVWGGSVGLTRGALDALELPRILAHTISEDAMIGSRAEALGLRVIVRRGLRLPTPLGGTLASVWRFARRQYQTVRIYRPGVWLVACTICTADLVTRAALVLLLLLAEGVASRIAAATLILLGLMGSATTQLRCSIGRRLGAADPISFVLTQHALVWSLLPAPAFHASAIWAGFFYSPLVWAHVRYTVDRQGRVVGAVRSPYPTRPR